MDDDILLEEAAEQLEAVRRRIADVEGQLEQARAKQSALDAILTATAEAGADKIRMQGFLQKKTPATTLTRGYDNRWFVLAGRQLRYYEEKGTIAVRRQDGVSAQGVTGDSTSFTLYAKGMQRKFELKAASEAERDRWVNCVLRRQGAADSDGGRAAVRAAEEPRRAAIAAQEAAQRGLLEQWGAAEHQLRRHSGSQEERLQAAQQRIDATAASRGAALEGGRDDTASAADDRAAELRSAVEAGEARHAALRRAAAAKLHRDTSLLVILGWWDKWRRWCSIRRRARAAEQVYDAAQAAAAAERELAAEAGSVAIAAAEQLAGRRGAAAAEEAAERAAIRLEEAELRGALRHRVLASQWAAEGEELSAEAAAIGGEAAALKEQLVAARGTASLAVQGAQEVESAAAIAQLEHAEAAARQEIAEQALPAWVTAAVASLRDASHQRSVGRILGSMSTWRGGLPWRWLYLWVDPDAGCVWYATRDPRFGEVEALPFLSIWAVRAEELGAECDPELLPGGAAQGDTCGFAVATVDGGVSRFVAASEYERDEWLETFTACAATAAAQQLRAARLHAAAAAAAADDCYSDGSPRSPGAHVPPRPALPGGSSWAALPGGGNPAAAAAATLVPGSPRRARRRVAESSPWGVDSGPSPQRSERRLVLPAASPRRYVW
eukprot:TRINITY_DN18913_c0_g1_i2.p1 TRINITY_DN18913_c0_g1~~TRINITY_DN18913_c0_g1_i2.p1  ORF type:complete len:693 (+),score=212.43 TRINITY_DN18913_c0_g1_i2:81-2081(+)